MIEILKVVENIVGRRLKSDELTALELMLNQYAIESRAGAEERYIKMKDKYRELLKKKYLGKKFTPQLRNVIKKIKEEEYEK